MHLNSLNDADARFLIETCPVGVVSINEDGLVSSVNQAFEQITGLLMTDVMHLPSHALWKKLLAHYTVDDQLKTYFAGVLTLRAKHALKAIRLNCQLHSTGTVRQVFYVQDITAESEVDRMKSEFLSAAAHELRTPMAIIHGFTDLLIANDYDKSTALEVVRTIHQQANSLTQLINELLDLVRIESRKGKDFVMKPQSLSNLLLEIQQDWAATKDANRLSFSYVDSLPLCNFDRDKIKQAIVNLISNACKYSQKDSPVILTLIQKIQDQVQWVGVEIRDLGVGMTKDQQAHLFERFWRAQTVDHIPGTGLGLAIVKEIVDIHKGRIDVVSQHKKGTTVTLWLPAMPSDAVLD